MAGESYPARLRVSGARPIPMPPHQLQQLLQQAVTHHRAGRLEDAAGLYRRIRVVAPRNFDAVHLSGVIELQRGRTAEAVDLLRKASSLNPQAAMCRMRLGLALVTSGRPKEAEPELREALRQQPDLVEGWDNLAFCLKTQDRLKEAVECHERVLQINPRYAAGWYNYGLTLSLYGRVGEALRCHERALAADPKYAKGHYGRAQALQQLNRPAEAVEAFELYLASDPKNIEAQGYRLFALNNLDTVSPEYLFEQHAAFGRALGATPVPAFEHERDPERKLRVAIISPDLRSHSCAYFLEPLLTHLDGARFELFLYLDHFREDAITQRFKAMAAGWRKIVGQPNATVEKLVREDRPDIVIDLAGHTGSINRLPIFARHLAPVQINYLGYPHSTGLPAIGYRLTDEIVDPSGVAEAFAVERLVRFAPTAWCYQAPVTAPEVSVSPCLATAEAPFTFGCFNNLGKVTDTTLRLWGRILAAVPDARFLFKGRGLDDQVTREWLLARFARCGLPSDRVELLGRTDETSQHLSLYSRMDVSLDTTPYSGTTTTCESLWMGVPVITLAGDRHAARVSASLLTAVGHSEWVAKDGDEYVAKAVAFAGDRLALAKVRAGLREEMRRSPLCDAAGQSQHFAAALRGCWREWCSGQPADGHAAKIVATSS